VTTRTPSAFTGRHEAASLLRAAGEQLETVIGESRLPVERLGGALRGMARLLATEEPGDGAESGGGAAVARRSELRAELMRAITALQFHDRMSQQLEQVRQCVAGCAGWLDEGSGDPPGSCGDPAAGSYRWPEGLPAGSGDIELF